MKRCYSLKRNKEFRYVYRVGKSVGSRPMVLVYTKSRLAELKIGFSVSKKIGNSVARNRVKRRMKESFRLMIPSVKRGYHLIFIAREPVVQEDFAGIQKAMRHLLLKAELYPMECKQL